VLLVTYLHYSTLPSIYSFYSVDREFYYIPIFLSALVFGLKGLLLLYLCVFVFEIPFVLKGWTGTFALESSQMLFLGLQGLFAIFARSRGECKESKRTVRKGARPCRIGQVATAIVRDLKNPLISILVLSKRIKDGKGNVDEAMYILMD